MGAATTTYYLLRWIVLDPWRMGASDPAAEQWHSPAGLLVLVAVVGALTDLARAVFAML
ncbi:hypothetical protein [Microbacterium sp. JZ31]|uniref:hypothetical protein n=1 Tax=Microbacterium sp. JZ31 TaxID=1906274 RepID=UPI001932184E|nr:hypothetical protein [Microbacterium sp. JZ31]